MGRAILLLILMLTTTGAWAADESSSRRGMFFVGGGDISFSHLHVTEDGRPDRTLENPSAFFNLGLGWHVAPRLALSLVAGSLHEAPRYRVLSYAATWYPRGWNTAGGSWFVEGRWGIVGTMDDFPGTGCPDWTADEGSVLTAGVGWERVLGRGRGGAARWSVRVLATLHGASSRVYALDRKEPVASIGGVAAKLGAALVWAPFVGGKEPWSEEPAAYRAAPFFGLGAGGGRGRAEAAGTDGVVSRLEDGGQAAWWRVGVRWSRVHLAFESTRWFRGDWQEPDLTAGLVLAGVRLGGLPLELLGGIGSTGVHADRNMGACVPIRREFQLAWSIGAAMRLVANERWSFDLRALYVDGGERYKADTVFSENPPVEHDTVLATAASSLLVVGLSVDWHLLPLRRD